MRPLSAAAMKGVLEIVSRAGPIWRWALRIMPVRGLAPIQHADLSCLAGSAVAQRQQQQFEVERMGFGGRSGNAGDDAGNLVADNGHEIAERCAVVLVPQGFERLALELAAEQAAYACSRQPEGGQSGRLVAENEAVPERGTDRARLDFAAIGSRAGAAPLVPVGVKGASRGMFHVTPRYRFRKSPLVSDRDIPMRQAG